MWVIGRMTLIILVLSVLLSAMTALIQSLMGVYLARLIIFSMITSVWLTVLLIIIIPFLKKEISRIRILLSCNEILGVNLVTSYIENT